MGGRTQLLSSPTGGGGGGGGDRLWSENGDESQMGGDQPKFRQLGEPPSPPREKTLRLLMLMLNNKKVFC